MRTLVWIIICIAFPPALVLWWLTSRKDKNAPAVAAATSATTINVVMPPNKA